MTTSLEDLRSAYEDNGRAFADTTWNLIEKLVTQKKLAFMTGFSVVPKPSDDGFEKFLSLQTNQAESSCRRDLAEQNVTDPTVLSAFMEAFRRRLLEHLHR